MARSIRSRVRIEGSNSGRTCNSSVPVSTTEPHSRPRHVCENYTNERLDVSRSHFRATAHAQVGVMDVLESVADRVRVRRGRPTTAEPEPTRVDRVREDARVLERRADARARTALTGVRTRVGSSRSSAPDDER
ncbi:DUF7553 family protein [Natrinema caseinilyticum]|uniref:DUF7553 family protein n=1 Tax=Natrinema caseinilyticum TaxID=2961570 RepID=UPI003CCD48E2